MAGCVTDGKCLFIRDDWQTDWNKPEQYRLLWATGLLSSDYPELVDQPAMCLSPGLFRINGLAVLLEYGGKTKPTKAETREVKKPRDAKGWHNGRWNR